MLNRIIIIIFLVFISGFAYFIFKILNDFSIPKRVSLFGNSDKKKVLLGVFAHPDDEILIGGTLLKYADDPHVDTYLLCLTKGDVLNGSLAQIREKEFRKATELLGVKDHLILDFSDMKLNQENETELIKSVSKYLRKTNPDVIITWGPDGFTFHPDHITTSKIVTEVFYKYKKMKDSAKLFYVTVPENVHKGTVGRTGFKEPESYYPPNMRINVFGHTWKKYKALLQYKSQIPILRKDVKIPLWLLVFVFNEYYYKKRWEAC